MKNVMYTIGFILGLMMAPNIYADYSHNKSSRHYDRHSGNKHNYESRIRKQHRRIERGVEEGSLTRKEVRKLEKRHHKFVKTKRSFWKDHYLTRAEQHLLDHKLDRISRKIYDYKHNNRVRRHEHHADYAYNHYQVKQHRSQSDRNNQHSYNYWKARWRY